jgi:hypothetical protein
MTEQVGCGDGFTSVLTVDWELQWIEFKVELTLSLNFLSDFVKHLFEHGHMKNMQAHCSQYLNIWTQ